MRRFIGGKLLVVLALLDVLTTNVALRLDAMELNPFMRPIIESWEGVALKIIITITLAFYITLRGGGRSWYVINGLMIIVIIINASTILTLMEV